jgi:hypothetical protein
MDQGASLTIITVSAFDCVRLNHTLTSLLSVGPNLELVVVTPRHDFETIQTVKNFTTYGNLKPRLVHDEGVGIYEAMNCGLKVAKGKFVTFWNSGDLAITSSSVGGLLDYLEATTTDWGVFQAKFGWRDALDLTSINLRRFVLQKGGYVSHQAIYARADTLRNLGGFDCNYKVAADTKMITQLWLEHDYGFYDHEVVEVEAPGFSGKMHRLGRIENFRIAWECLPLGSKFLAVGSALRREVGYLARKIKNAISWKEFTQ